MPLVFQAGLFCTVLVMGGVRLLKSLRGVKRLPGGPGGLSGVGRERWLHLAIIYGVALFCGPFLLALAMPSRAARMSASLDAAFGGGAPVPELHAHASTVTAIEPAAGASESAGPTATDRLAAAQRARRSEMRVGLVIVLSCAGAAVAAAFAAGAARTRRRPDLMTAATFAALVASGAGFALAGPAASRLSGALQARRAVEGYAAVQRVPADGTGPVRLVGRPDPLASGGAYIFLCRPDSDEGDARVAAVESFRLAGTSVPAGGGRVVRVARPRVRLGGRGRERFIRADEDVTVFGFAVAGTIVPDLAFPAVVAPADAPRVLEKMSADLLGAARPRALLVALLQVLFASGTAWAMALLLASATEHLLARRARAIRLRPSTAVPAQR